MKIKVLGYYREKVSGFYNTGFLLNDHLLLDAGEIGGGLEIKDQLNITNVLITHAHLDHIAGLPFLADTLFGQINRSISIISIPPVIDAIHQHIFNNKIWPDFTKLPAEGPTVFKLHPISVARPYLIEEFIVTSFPVCHPVPAVSFLIVEKQGAILYSGDTGCVQELIQIINANLQIKALLMEISFPNRLKKLAEQTGHLTPDSLNIIIYNINRPLPLWLFHMKPQYIEEISRECVQFKDQVYLLRHGETLYI